MTLNIQGTKEWKLFDQMLDHYIKVFIQVFAVQRKVIADKVRQF